MKCPQCGQEMEEGYQTTDGPSVFWSKKKPPKIGIWLEKKYGTERIRGCTLKVDLRGFRCAKCKVLMLYYGEDEEKGESVEG